MTHDRIALILVLTLASAAFAGCAGSNDSSVTGSAQEAGSSTVYPIAEAWAEELSAKGVQVTAAGGGSGAGASKLCAKEIDIGALSRRMKDTEVEKCRANGVEPEEWTIAFDGLTVVVAKSNTFVDKLTAAELKRIWESGSTVKTWADVRADWPAQEIRLYGPDSDSGTYEYFAEEILGKKCGPEGKALCPPRSDYTPAADDNVLVEGVRASPNALGYFGYAYYHENQDTLKAVPIVPKDATEAVSPSFETIRDGSYKPFSRPLFVYTDGVPAAGTATRAFLDHAFGAGQEVIREVGYVELDAATLQQMKQKL